MKTKLIIWPVSFIFLLLLNALVFPDFADAFSGIKTDNIGLAEASLESKDELAPELQEARSTVQYTIDNNVWGIIPDNNDVQIAFSNVIAINNALEWAEKHGYSKVLFQQGTYYIGVKNINLYFASNKGSALEEKAGASIFVPSNLEVDLNGATFCRVGAACPAYSFFTLFEVSNVKIHNGTLIGDSTNPGYKDQNSTCEYGFGVDLRGSRNIELYDLNISYMIGDAMCIGGNDKMLANGKGILSEDVLIRDCTIFKCRRQGISVIGADKLMIKDCTISDIRGTSPQSGIDLEASNDWLVRNITIQNNNISKAATAAILVSKNSDTVSISDNTIEGFIGLVYGVDTKIYNNRIINGGISSTETMEPVRTVIEKNFLQDSEIRIYTNSGTIVGENTFVDTYVIFSFANGAIYRNTFKSDKLMNFAIQVYADEKAGTHTFQVYIADNKFEGSYKSKILFSHNKYAEIIYDNAALLNYLNEFKNTTIE